MRTAWCFRNISAGHPARESVLRTFTKHPSGLAAARHGAVGLQAGVGGVSGRQGRRCVLQAGGRRSPSAATAPTLDFGIWRPLSGLRMWGFSSSVISSIHSAKFRWQTSISSACNCTSTSWQRPTCTCRRSRKACNQPSIRSIESCVELQVGSGKSRHEPALLVGVAVRALRV